MQTTGERGVRRGKALLLFIQLQVHQVLLLDTPLQIGEQFLRRGAAKLGNAAGCQSIAPLPTTCEVQTAREVRATS
jgi:hypothetical protein